MENSALPIIIYGMVRTLILAAAASLFTANALRAQTWDGGGANDRWSIKNNWNPNTNPSFNNSTDLIFSGSTRTSPDMNGSRTVNSITFDSGAAAFTLLGDNGPDSETLAFGGGGAGIVQNSANDQTMLMNRIRFNSATTITVTGAGDLYLGDGTASAGLLYGANNLTKDGTGGSLILRANNSNWSGNLAIDVGVVEARADNALGDTGGTTTVATGAALNLGAGGLAIAESFTLSGTGIADAGALRNITGSNSVSGAIVLGADARINADTGTLTLTGDITGAGQGLTLGGVGNVTVSGAVGTTTGTLTKDGAGTVILSGTNTYSGSTTVSAGTLQIGDAGTSGTFGSGGGVTNNAAVTLNRTDAFTVNNTISGTGTLTHAGTGTTTLSSANSYDGATTVTAGVLKLQNATALGTTAGGTSVAAGAALQLDSGGLAIAESVTLSGTGSGGTGALRNTAGSGTNTVSAAIAIAGDTRINADAGGTLALTGGITGTDRNLTVGGAGDVSVSGAIATGTGSLTKDGAGTLRLAATNSFTGITVISAGTIVAEASAVFSGTAALTVGAGALLDLNSTAQTVGNLGGSGTVGFGTGGSLTLASGSGTFSGGFTGSGTIIVGAGATLTLGFDFNAPNLNLILAGGSLNLNGTTATFGTLNITGTSVLDFGSSTASVLTVNNVTFQSSGLQLTLQNWVNLSDYFYAQTFTGATTDTRGVNPVNQIAAGGYANNDTVWQSYDSQITPVPEPSVYGALFMLGTAGFVVWRRRSAQRGQT